MIRYNVSHINRNGDRVLFGPNQGRHFSDTRAEKEAWLQACLENTGEDILAHLCGEQSRGTFRVDPFDCYENGDAVGIYVKEHDETKAIKSLKVTVEYTYPNGDKVELVPVNWQAAPGVSAHFDMSYHRPIRYEDYPAQRRVVPTGEDSFKMSASRLGPPQLGTKKSTP